MDQILNPVARDESQWEDCVFDDWGRAFCTENPWNDPGKRRSRTLYSAFGHALHVEHSDALQISILMLRSQFLRSRAPPALQHDMFVVIYGHDVVEVNWLRITGFACMYPCYIKQVIRKHGRAGASSCRGPDVEVAFYKRQVFYYIVKGGGLLHAAAADRRRR